MYPALLKRHVPPLVASWYTRWLRSQPLDSSVNRICILSLIGTTPYCSSVSSSSPTALCCTNGDGFRLQTGADCLHRNVYGQTALHLAAQGGHVNTVLVVLAAGIPVTSKDSKACIRFFYVERWRYLLLKATYIEWHESSLCCSKNRCCSCDMDLQSTCGAHSMRPSLAMVPNH